MKFYFIRHGQTDWNLEERLQGHTDIRLNSTGIQQAINASTKLEGLPIDLIVTSPLLRALQTASIISEKIQTPLHIENQIKERGFGSFEGLVKGDIQKKHNLEPHESFAHLFPEDAESWADAMQRGKTSISKWLEQHADKTILFVSHGAFFRALHEALSGAPYSSRAENATPYLFEHKEGNWSAELV